VKEAYQEVARRLGVLPPSDIVPMLDEVL
jgi:hypothetical protein